MGRGTAVAGVGLMALAGAGWAAVFVAPLLAPLASALLLATGRFVAYGLVSLAQLRAVLARGLPWGRVAAQAVTGSVLYYALVATAVRLAGPTVAVATIGLVPVVMAVISARHRGRDGLRALAPALTLVAVGQALVHAGPAPADGATGTGGTALAGTLVALVAVASWTWYGLDSHRLLAARPDLTGVLAGAQGLAAGALALPVVVLLLALGGLPPAPGRALLVVLGLGLVSSWVAVRCWHAAAARLSPVLTSQLMALESAWGFGFAAAVEGRTPTPWALAGEVALVAGVVLAVWGERRGRRPERGAAQPVNASRWSRTHSA